MPATSPIVRALRAAHLHDAPRAELLQLACDRLRSLGAPYTSVYAYMLQDGGSELMLEAFSGRETERSEEHTSELQSQSNLVCRLLLEKKKEKRHRSKNKSTIMSVIIRKY